MPIDQSIRTNAAKEPDDPIAELRAEQLGKKYGRSEVCPAVQSRTALST